MRDGFSNGAAAIRFRRLDTPLATAPTKLHQTAFGQASKWDAACNGRIDNGARARAQTHVFVQIFEVRQSRLHIEKHIIDGREA